MGSPSRKDYIPVPVEERIDDGVEARQEDVEASDDEGIYNTSAPLLSNRARGNDPPRTQERSFFHGFRRWNLFGVHDPWAATWSSSRPKRNYSWFRVFIMGFTGVLVAAVIGLSISTAVLSKRPQRCPSYYRHYYRQYTHMPLNQDYISQNNRLNFVRLYPPLKTEPGSACQTAWQSLSYIPCHEKIWNRSWDNGKHQSLFDPDISYYASEMCSDPCSRAIARAYQLILSQCTQDDKFDLEGYVGSFSADPGLEEGPVGAITTIERRIQHTCRQSPYPERYQSRGPYCSAEMWLDWFIVDGMNTGNLEGLDLFEAKTRSVRSEPGHYRYTNQQETCDNANGYSNNRYIAPRQYGPGPNQTTCGWCTIDWFDRKLQSWKKEKVLDPKNSTVVELQEYLHRIKMVGQRCEADSWDRIWAKALRKYKNEGLLPPSWEDDGHNDGGRKKPCRPCEEDKEVRIPG